MFGWTAKISWHRRSWLIFFATFWLSLFYAFGSPVNGQTNTKGSSETQEMAIAELNRMGQWYIALMEQSVQDELGLSDDQKSQIKVAIDDYKKLNREIQANPELSQDVILAQREEIRKSSDIIRTEILLPRQFDQLEKLAFVAQLKSSGNGFNSVLTNPYYAEKFGFSREQIEELKKLSKNAMEDQKAAMRKYRSEIAAIQERSQKVAWRIMNEEQRELFQKLRGSDSPNQ